MRGPKESRFNSPAGWVARKWHAVKRRPPVRCRSRRCGQRSITVSPRRRRRRETLACRCGSTKVRTREKLPMALMPKRVKHRKSQRGRIKGKATRGNRVVHGDYGLQAMQGGWISAQTLEAGRIAAAQY